MTERAVRLAQLLQERSLVDVKISKLMGRPALIGHAGEFLAAELFDLALWPSATHRGSDGTFRSGALAGKTANVKWYAVDEGMLDMRDDPECDYYLVFTGPRVSVDKARPWKIVSVYLIEAAPLRAILHERGTKIGVATSVPRAVWDASRVFPDNKASLLDLGPDQIAALQEFA